MIAIARKWIRRNGTLHLLLLGMASASAQDHPDPSTARDLPIRLTVDEAISAALSSNHDLKLATLDENIAGSRYKETQAVFLPQAAVSYSAMTTNNPLDAFGFKLQQKTIGVDDFNPARLNHPAATPDFMTSVDIWQPLLNMDQLYQRKAAGKQREVYALKGQRTREAVRFEVRRAYMQLQLAYRAQQFTTEALSAARELYRFTQDRVDQGLLSRADALNIEVQAKATETRLAEAASQIMNASDLLSFIMGKPLGSVYSVDSASLTTSASIPADSTVPAGRADIAALGKAIDASDDLLRSGKLNALPRLNAFGSYQLNDSRMFGFGAGGYLAGLRLSWDIFKGNTIRNRNATMLLQRNKLSEQLSQLKDQSNAELLATRRKLGDAAFRIGQQQSAVAASAESFRILRDRYQQGLTGSIDVLLAHTQLSQQQLALAQAIYELGLTRAYWEYLTTSSGK